MKGSSSAFDTCYPSTAPSLFFTSLAQQEQYPLESKWGPFVAGPTCRRWAAINISIWVISNAAAAPAAAVCFHQLEIMMPGDRSPTPGDRVPEKRCPSPKFHWGSCSVSDNNYKLAPKRKSSIVMILSHMGWLSPATLFMCIKRKSANHTATTHSLRRVVALKAICRSSKLLAEVQGKRGSKRL